MELMMKIVTNDEPMSDHEERELHEEALVPFTDGPKADEVLAENKTTPNWDAANAMVESHKKLKAKGPKAQAKVDKKAAKIAAELAATDEAKVDKEVEVPDPRWDAVDAAREAGTLKPTLIKAVKKYAKRKVEEDEDLRWQPVLKLSDKAIWEVIEWCSFERGAISMMARAAKKLCVGVVDGVR